MDRATKQNSFDPPLLLTVQEVVKILRVNRPKVYELIRQGVISGFKVGADWRVRRDSLELLIGPLDSNNKEQ